MSLAEQKKHLVIVSGSGWYTLYLYFKLILTILGHADRGHLRPLLQLALNLMSHSPFIHVTALCAPEGHGRMKEELGRQKHLPEDVRNRFHCIEVIPPPEGSVDEDAIPNENIKGIAAPLLDLIRAEGESKVGDEVRSAPNVIIHDVRRTTVIFSMDDPLSFKYRYSAIQSQKQFESSSPSTTSHTFLAYTSVLCGPCICSGKINLYHLNYLSLSLAS